MKSTCSSPGVWLTVTPLVVLLALALAGQLSPEIEPDSETYLNFDWSSLASALSQIRTFGYPLFLKIMSPFGGERFIPVGHWLALVLAVWTFYWGLKFAGYCTRTALWCSMPLFLGRSIWDRGQPVLGDSLAISLAIACTGCFFAVLGYGRTINAAANSQRDNTVRAVFGWLGLILFTFLTYQVRPAYLFLIPLWPLLGMGLDMLLFRRRAGWRRWFQRGVFLIAATTVPFLAFCSLRWQVVGHWGLVSFGGYNIVGVAGQCLDEKLAAELPEDLRPLAQEIIAGRAALGLVPSPDNFLAMEAAYNPTVWKLIVPAANRLNNNDTMAVNQQLNRLAKEILKRRPAAYLRWLIWNANHARHEIVPIIVFDPGTTMIIGAFLVLLLVSLLRGPNKNRRASLDTDDTVERRHLEQHCLFWTATAFAMAKICLVILVEPAIGRYVLAAASLMPAAIAVWIAHWQQPLVVTESE